MGWVLAGGRIGGRTLEKATLAYSTLLPNLDLKQPGVVRGRSCVLLRYEHQMQMPKIMRILAQAQPP